MNGCVLGEEIIEVPCGEKQHVRKTCGRTEEGECKWKATVTGIQGTEDSGLKLDWILFPSQAKTSRSYWRVLLLFWIAKIHYLRFYEELIWSDLLSQSRGIWSDCVRTYWEDIAVVPIIMSWTCVEVKMESWHYIWYINCKMRQRVMSKITKEESVVI